MFRKKTFLPPRPDLWQAGAFFAIGAGAGAGLMYLLDPERGARRRALIHDKTAATIHEAEKSITRRKEDLENRIAGAAAEARSLFRKAPVADEPSSPACAQNSAAWSATPGRWKCRPTRAW
jgi:hypothetical protein